MALDRRDFLVRSGSALAAAAVLVLCGFIAAFAPAMHATRIDPVAALREE